MLGFHSKFRTIKMFMVILRSMDKTTGIVGRST
jgi:hypothetical protein